MTEKRTAFAAALTLAITASTIVGAAQSAALVTADHGGAHAPTTFAESPVETASVVAAPPTPVEPEAPAAPVIIADPVDGDLRFDERADVLPLAYVPPQATVTMRDVAYGTDPEQKLDLYLPDGPDAPVVVYLHAGGWVAGSKDNVPDLVLRFVERGYAVASVGYRLAPDHIFPAQIHDVKRAIRSIKAYAEAGDAIDGDRMVVYGTSAGGHLASFVAATPGSFEPGDLDSSLAAFDSSVSGVVSAVGPTDLVSLYHHDNAWAGPLTAAFVGCDPCSDEQLAPASPITHLHADLPPAYWAYGPEDALIEVESQAVAMADAWAAAAGPDSSLLDLVDGLGHNLDENTVNQRAIEAFVDAVTSGADPADGASRA